MPEFYGSKYDRAGITPAPQSPELPNEVVLCATNSFPVLDLKQARMMRNIWNDLLKRKFDLEEQIINCQLNNMYYGDLLIEISSLKSQMFELDFKIHKLLFIPIIPKKRKK